MSQHTRHPCTCTYAPSRGYFCLVCRSFAPLYSLKTTAACNCHARTANLSIIRILNFPARASLAKRREKVRERKRERERVSSTAAESGAVYETENRSDRDCTISLASIPGWNSPPPLPVTSQTERFVCEETRYTTRGQRLQMIKIQDHECTYAVCARVYVSRDLQ